MRSAAETKTDILELPDRDRDEMRHWLDVHQDVQEIIELSAFDPKLQNLVDADGRATCREVQGG